MIRIGHGFDVHAFGEDRPLMIAGVEVPYHTGFIAHSDGDVALHALTDALLGAAALGDIGKLFPDTDMQYKNADSRGLLIEAYRQVQEQGYQVGNVDVTIIAQAPKMRPHIDKNETGDRRRSTMRYFTSECKSHYNRKIRVYRAR